MSAGDAAVSRFLRGALKRLPSVHARDPIEGCLNFCTRLDDKSRYVRHVQIFEDGDLVDWRAADALPDGQVEICETLTTRVGGGQSSDSINGIRFRLSHRSHPQLDVSLPDLIRVHPIRIGPWNHDPFIVNFTAVDAPLEVPTVRFSQTWKDSDLLEARLEHAPEHDVYLEGPFVDLFMLLLGAMPLLPLLSVGSVEGNIPALCFVTGIFESPLRTQKLLGLQEIASAIGLWSLAWADASNGAWFRGVLVDVLQHQESGFGLVEEH